MEDLDLVEEEWHAAPVLEPNAQKRGGRVARKREGPTPKRPRRAASDSHVTQALEKLEAAPIFQTGLESGIVKNCGILVGSECAGLVAEKTALELLGQFRHGPNKQIHFTQAFITEASRAVRHLLYQRFGTSSIKYYKDVATRNAANAPRLLY